MTEVMNEKPWWQSRTIVGALVVAVVSFVGGGNAALQAELTDLVMHAIAIVGAVMSVLGRFSATKRLKL